MMASLSPDTRAVLLVVLLLLVPRALQRFRIPSAITALFIGAAAGFANVDVGGGPTLHLLATLGISSLFLFAGMEVDFAELRRSKGVVAGHLLVQAAMLLVVASAARAAFGLGWAPAVIFALALLTPSTGFILDSLAGFGLVPAQDGWVRSKAIATELVALTILFFTVQSDTHVSLFVSTLTLVLMVATLPWAFRLFARHVLPWAPRSEFSFLVVIAVVCAMVTRRLGVYYLVGAFVVGITALRLRQRVPELSSPQLVGAVELFASFFIPFYFFEAGYQLRDSDLGPGAIATGLLLLALASPLRVLAVAVHRRQALGEPVRSSASVAVALLPTLVFTLVLAQILRERFGLAPHLVGALALYAVGTTLAPGLLLRGALARRQPSPPVVSSAPCGPAEPPPQDTTPPR